MEDYMTDASTIPQDSVARDRFDARQATRIWGSELASTWAVKRLLESGYYRATGREIPTARDRNVPFRRVILWAAVSAAAVAIANVVADRVVLRPRQPLDT